jgi:sulfate transport system substrate-binding protein
MATTRLSILLLVALVLHEAPAAAEGRQITNASYDVTREFYADYNRIFLDAWKARTGETLTVQQSHGGSSKQARAVIDGLDADVVTMNQSIDIDRIAEIGGKLTPDWASRLPNGSSPFSSIIVFLVRKGNPKSVRDWDDLTKPGVGVVIPNPKTSGNGRYGYLAAWGHAARKPGTDASAQDFVRRLLANAPVLDTGGRGSTTTFAERGIGDVLLTFESEVSLIQAEFPEAGFEIVMPSTSIRADLPVAWVDEVVKRRGTEDVARAYLEGLYATDAQELGARRGYRPSSREVAARFEGRFPSVTLHTVEEVAGGWKAAMQKHFSDGGTFDQVYAPGAPAER